MKKLPLLSSAVFVFAVSQVFAVSALAKPAAEARILVLRVKGGSQDDAKKLNDMTQGLVHALAAQSHSAVIGENDLQDLLKTEEIQQLTGCTDERCVADLSQAAAADQIVSARLGQLGSKQLLWLALVDSKEARVQARSATEIPDKADLQKALRKAAADLFSSEAEKLGDLSFSDLRVALVFDEFDADGHTLHMHGVEACVTKQFIDAGVQMVSPDAVAAIKKQADPRLLAIKKNLDALSVDDVDLVVAGAVEVGPMPLGKAFAGQKNDLFSKRGDLSLSMFRTDSGEILASEHQEATRPGYSSQGARAAVEKALCEQVKPALAKALSKSRERGIRIKLKIKGAKTQKRLQAIIKDLASLPHVGRVKLRHFSPKSSSVDLVAKGVDGLGLAVDISNSAMKARVRSASASRMQLQVK